MYQEETDCPYGKHECKRIHQGDIFRDVLLIDWHFTDENNTQYEVLDNTIPYIVIITQECDLDQDFIIRNKTSDKQDKYLQSLLVCPAYLSEKFRKGIHLEKYELKMEEWNSERYKVIKSQKNERFHYLEGNSDLQIPKLVIDFKHYFTIPTDILYDLQKEHYIGSLKQLFRENLSHRFSFFLSRIGLPEIKLSESGNITA